VIPSAQPDISGISYESSFSVFALFGDEFIEEKFYLKKFSFKIILTQLFQD